ncbi:S-methyl-5-thioribose kinase [Macrococcus hajekii]|uniref:S-methyl-5-thioribose kinase n=1 Tax=Macrococcus hajekii TaxID=198482 RepID=A0A4R6BHY9_9STAP|nr:S-methyl-5-thioribose kinase [Macrococcus hajekii]TDM01218.1 S-methyl-5-thioribose kinase [Macrococcus hajekii]GGB11596.1 methylthioribose kinase [Macrococcus hajekii]
MDFSTYFLMDEVAVAQYAREKIDKFNGNQLSVTEIGDGNLNYVFRVSDGEQSVIIKHSGVTARISDEFVLSTDRTIREGRLIEAHSRYVPDQLPEIISIDLVMKCVVMEDLKDYAILRTALQQGDICPHLGKSLGHYLSETLIRTSDFVLPAKEKKSLQKEMINPELCEITEDLVYTEPFYNNFSRNEISSELELFVEKYIYGDASLKAAVAQAKLKFLNKAESLIHGDLHSGSIFIKKDGLKVIDPEFGFFGPAGYDVGNVIAHLFFAYANAQASGREEQAIWLKSVVDEILATFREEALTILTENTYDIALRDTALFAAFITEIERDAYIVAGLELIRRIVGLAKVSDITQLHAERVNTEKKLLTFAKFLIQHPDKVRIYSSLFKIYEAGEEQVA